MRFTLINSILRHQLFISTSYKTCLKERNEIMQINWFFIVDFSFQHHRWLETLQMISQVTVSDLWYRESSLCATCHRPKRTRKGKLSSFLSNRCIAPVDLIHSSALHFLSILIPPLSSLICYEKVTYDSHLGNSQVFGDLLQSEWVTAWFERTEVICDFINRFKPSNTLLL